MEKGIPPEIVSCHTDETNGYVIEGQAPPADIHHLLDELPDALGLAVLDIPHSSSRTVLEGEREAYEGFLVHHDRGAEVLFRYDAVCGSRSSETDDAVGQLTTRWP